ncbi:hypothetical protein JOF53_000227 [Crossiella equi]|uniref:DNA helicase n=1 Tax=Crossiella equi TaxID=130796 RepID=A0ABS5A6K8_9PSEU|nr:AAA domain-containing protein [Crossiella equi]MBP2471355.1 hypothetical protein [Crossiella equi]
MLIREPGAGPFIDKTREVAEYAMNTASGRVHITFHDGRSYPYGSQRVRVLRPWASTSLAAGTAVEVDGAIWENATEVVTFVDQSGTDNWARIFKGESYHTVRAEQARLLTSATQGTTSAKVLRYWRGIVRQLPSDDPLRFAYDKLDFVHPESALGAFLTGKPIESRDLPGAPIFPFRCNLSQRQAVELALTRSVSVIEGPPGTGKTETILNLIANLVLETGTTVGVVSFGNTAVDNVRDKLHELGFGYVIANLGRREKRAEFFATQQVRAEQVNALVRQPTPEPDLDRLAKVDQRLRHLQAAERTRAERRRSLEAHQLELRHFQLHTDLRNLPELSDLPLLRRSANRVLDYLAESELEHAGARPGLLRRIVKYFKYGFLRGLDPSDTGVVLRLQQAYYDRRIAELTAEVGQIEDKLRHADFDGLVREHQTLSAQALRAQLGRRYRGLKRTIYQEKTFRQSREFAEDYPVLLSTCHSLRASTGGGALLDYLVIDEASQVNLLVAALAMSMCRNLVVVGDEKQLSPIPIEVKDELVPPARSYEAQRHSLISAMKQLHGEALPRTLLREHYRCDPAIIEFCNKKFYRGELIPYTTSGADRSMVVLPTSEGNHMRQHRGGGRSNQREVDVIAEEAMHKHGLGVPNADFAVTTPYRLQANKAAAALPGSEADTVHKFQGRQKPVIVMSTVLDETWRGRTGLKFVDDPQMINVAVSRAIRRFILVTNHDMLPTSRHVRDLVGYIRYQAPDEETDTSTVVSVFDLLYRAYSPRLRALAARRRHELKYDSEDIIWTVLHDLLAEQHYAHLTVVTQVLLSSLIPSRITLTPEQAAYVRHRASVDFVVYNRVTNRPLLAIEVDGFTYHENNPVQLKRDELKNAILHTYRMPLLRLPTTGSGEEDKIRQALDEAEAHWARISGEPG